MAGMSKESIILIEKLTKSLNKDNGSDVLEFADMLETIDMFVSSVYSANSEEVSVDEDDAESCDDMEVEYLSLEPNVSTTISNGVEYYGKPDSNMVVKYINLSSGETVGNELRPPIGYDVKNYGTIVKSSDIEDVIVIGSDNHIFTFIPASNWELKLANSPIRVSIHTEIIDIAISGDALTLVVSTTPKTQYTPVVEVFKRDTIRQEWEIVDTLYPKDSDAHTSFYGSCLYVNYNGDTIFVGAPVKELNTNVNSRIFIYSSNTDDSSTYQEQDALLSVRDNYFGSKFALSKDGKVLVNLIENDGAYELLVVKIGGVTRCDKPDNADLIVKAVKDEYTSKTILNIDETRKIGLIGSYLN